MAYASASYPLLADATATGSPTDWPGGKGVFTVYKGTFGGSTVRLQWSPDDGTTWLDVDANGDSYVSKTAVGSGMFELPPCKLRAHVSGGPPSALFAAVKGI